MLALAAAAIPTVAAAQPAAIAGRWITSDRAALVEVGPCGATVCGRIARVLVVDPTKPTRDVNNPDPALRRRSIVGMPILTGFTADGDRWVGRIYDPRNGKSYRSVLLRDGAALKVKGCIAFFCQTQRWTRAG